MDETNESGEMNFFKFLGDFNRSVLVQDVDEELDKKISQFLKTRDTSKGRKGLHVSMFSDPCLRRMVLHVLQPDLKDPSAPNKLQRIFDCGTATHNWFQEEYLGPMGILEGTWRCSICGKKIDGLMPKTRCDSTWDPAPWEHLEEASCAGRRAHWEFLEPRVHFDHAGLAVVGSCDGILNLNGKKSVLEMKTKDSGLFADLMKPEVGHVVQGSLYAIKLGLANVTIVYIEKNEWKLKIYSVPVEQWVMDWFTSLVDQVAAVVRMGDYHAAPIKCANKNASRAQRCGARSLCFPKDK